MQVPSLSSTVDDTRLIKPFVQIPSLVLLRQPQRPLPTSSQPLPACFCLCAKTKTKPPPPHSLSRSLASASSLSAPGRRDSEEAAALRYCSFLMASACVNNMGMSSAAKSYPPYGWLSPRMSFGREADHPPSNTISAVSSDPPAPDPPELQDPVDFEFRLDDPVAMLPADELFSDGKLMPLQLAPGVSNNAKPSDSSAVNPLTESNRRSAEQSKSCGRLELEISSAADPYLFSPKAPRCSSRWKELLGLKKLYQNPSNGQKPDKTAASSSSPYTTATSNTKSLKHFLHRNSKSCSCSASLDHSLSLPLLKDPDYLDSVSIASTRLSLSSSSSSHDHDDLPRLSLDAEKPSTMMTTTTTHLSPNPFVLNRAQNVAASRVRMVKARSTSFSGPAGCDNNGGGRVGRSPMRREAGESDGVGSRGVSVDSPRMNSSGKIVFQSLERSSSSPGSFNGGPRLKHRGMERSYSANVRIAPVLNVPVCSLRGTSISFGFGQLFSSSPQKREGFNKGQSQHHYHHHQPQQPQSYSRNRTDRT